MTKLQAFCDAMPMMEISSHIHAQVFHVNFFFLPNRCKGFFARTVMKI